MIYLQTNGYMYKFPSPLHSFLRHSFKTPTCLTILQGITICPTYRPPVLRRGPSKNSSEFTSKRLSSWSVPTKVPRKTRLSLVTTRRVWLSNALTAVIAGELKADGLAEVDIAKTRSGFAKHAGPTQHRRHAQVFCDLTNLQRAQKFTNYCLVTGKGVHRA